MRTKQSARMYARKRSLGVPPLATLNPKRHRHNSIGQKAKAEYVKRKQKQRNTEKQKQRAVDCKEQKLSLTTMETLAKKYLKRSLKDIPKDDLKALVAAINNELKGRHSLDDMIAKLRKSYSNIEWGYGDWKSDKTSDAVSRLCELGTLEKKIRKAILALDDDVEGQWTAALSFSLELVRMIRTAEDCAGKLVNGSMGEWCPDAAASIESLWEDLVAKERRPSDELLSEVREELDGCLGDYEHTLPGLLDGITD